MTSSIRKRVRRSLLLVSALSSGVVVAGSATAQQSPQVAQAGAVQEEIVVTGSRIVRDGFQAPTPVTVLGADEINRVAAINLIDVVTKLPTLSQSYNSHTGGMSTSDGNAGTNSLSLRGLGANRTLVLLDGVRVTGNSVTGFYGTGGSVDTNAFPDALISRVDVVTGGATAAYGSGALTGVVNMILDKQFTGIKGNVTAGITTYGDDPQYTVSLTGGTPFANARGHLLISASHHYTHGIPNGRSREFVRNVWGRITNPNYTATNGQPFYIYADQVGLSANAIGGVVTGGPLKGTTFGPGGVPRQFIYGPLNDGFAMSGGEWEQSSGRVSGTWGPDSSLDIRVARQNLFTRASYDLSDNVQVYAQFVNSEASTHANARYNADSLTIQRDNVFLPPEIVQRMIASNVTSIPLGVYVTQLGPLGGDIRRHFTQYLGGVEGSFDVGETNWSWNVFATRSTARTSATVRGVFPIAKFRAAVDSIRGPTGVPVCRVNTDANPANDLPGCVPYNVIGENMASKEAMAYVTADKPYLIQYIWLDQANASFSGEPFSTWAGPVSLAAGVEYHKNSARGEADPIAQAVGYSTGNYNSTTGSYNTKEAFAETVVPLASGQSFAQSLELNAGVRYTDFSTSGVVWTWKVGASYAPIEDLRFRATRSRDTRSPNMGELFARGLFTNAMTTDPFQPGNPTVPYQSLTSGNPTLAPEKGNVTGLGAVYSPSWFQGFTTSFDYFKIDIFISIANQGGAATLARCLEGQQNFCANIERNAPLPGQTVGTLTRIYARPTNSGGARQAGWDWEASYRTPLSNFVESWDANISIRGLLTHITEQDSTNPDGVVTINTNAPWRYNISLTYDSGPFSAGWTGRGVSRKLLDGNDIECTSGCPARITAQNIDTVNINSIPPMFFMDVDFKYRTQIGEAVETDFFLSIENIANKFPPGIAAVGPLSDIPTPLGRIFRGGIRFRM
jgi:iron complex outermembrane receptor protein